MVTLNLTLLIEVGLFLIFLGGTARFILHPLLDSIDERETGIAQDKESAEVGMQAAEKLESEYTAQLSELRRQADEALRVARGKVTKEHHDHLAVEYEKADQQVLDVRQESLERVEQERELLTAAIPEVADLIAERLKAGGPSS